MQGIKCKAKFNGKLKQKQECRNVETGQKLRNMRRPLQEVICDCWRNLAKSWHNYSILWVDNGDEAAAVIAACSKAYA